MLMTCHELGGVRLWLWLRLLQLLQTFSYHIYVFAEPADVALDDGAGAAAAGGAVILV